MLVHATYKNARMAPRKIRTVAAVVSGLPVLEAKQQLASFPGKAARILQSTLSSAIANAVHTFDAKEDSLIVDKVIVNEGIKLKRYQPVWHGTAHPITKCFSHVTVVVGGKETSRKGKTRKTAIEDIPASTYTSKLEPETKRSEELEEMAADQKGKGLRVPSPDETSDKQSIQAFQKKKMIQQGGDRKKTFRRKSM